MNYRLRTSAFTLVELLVAIAISTILAALLASFCGSTLVLWQQQTADNERRNAAIAVFGQIRHDLRYAALPSDQPNSSLQMVINPPTSWISSSYLLPQAAFWQAPSATDRSKGENAIVGYFIQWTASSSLSSFMTPKLCRLLINPSSTDYHLNAPPWVTTALLTSDAPATAPYYTGLIAGNVLGLWMQPLDQNQNVITLNSAGTSFSPEVFDSRSGYQSSNSRTYPNALPTSLKVSIIVLDNRTAQRLTGTEKPSGTSDAPTYYATLSPDIRKGAQVYSTLVNLVNAPQ